MKILVTGAGGFIGHHLVNRLVKDGHEVTGMDLKYPEFEKTAAREFLIQDLRKDMWWTMWRLPHFDEVYALAADMGGMGYIAYHDYDILQNNLRINLNTAKFVEEEKVGRLLFSSSACVYPKHLQDRVANFGLKEVDAFPADPEDGYGWEKLTAEYLYGYLGALGKTAVRMVRFHNIFGPLGTWQGGREKAPAALCRKIAYAKMTGDQTVQIWGDGQQTRSFCYVDDCIDGLLTVMNSRWAEPVNIGQDRLVSINWLADTIAEIAGVKIEKMYVEGPQGVRGRNSDNAIAKQELNWRPKISLEEGLAKTYTWIEKQLEERTAATQVEAVK